VTSPASGTVSMPAARNSVASVSSFGPERELATLRRRRRLCVRAMSAIASHTPRPMPPVAPVTSAWKSRGVEEVDTT
jgi:hypothetical protein